MLCLRIREALCLPPREPVFSFSVFFGPSKWQERPLETSVCTKCQLENHRFLLFLSEMEGVELGLRDR